MDSRRAARLYVTHRQPRVAEVIDQPQMTNIYFNIHIRVFRVIFIAIKCDKKKKKQNTIKAKTEKEICVYGNVMVQVPKKITHEDRKRTRRKGKQERKRGKRGREIEK